MQKIVLVNVMVAQNLIAVVYVVVIILRMKMILFRVQRLTVQVYVLVAQ